MTLMLALYFAEKNSEILWCFLFLYTKLTKSIQVSYRLQVVVSYNLLLVMSGEK